MDKKKQLKNVAFGGDWSEKSLEDHEKKMFLKEIKKIYESCFCNEISEKDLQEILYYMKNNLEKGHIFAKSFEEKLQIKDPYLRKAELTKTINNIRKWLAI
tara:strand:- start:145 stop:447 length:303 start_codon:yes stop_codon:yes gene_type:complete